VTQGAMPIDATEFGAITINGKTYDHDVIIRLSGGRKTAQAALERHVRNVAHGFESGS
jgi:hypothetical protein